MLFLYDAYQRLHMIFPWSFICAAKDGNMVNIVFAENGETCSIWLEMKLDDLREKLDYPCILYSEDSWLINLNHVWKVYSHQLITDSGKCFPLNSDQVSMISEMLQSDPVRFKDTDRISRKRQEGKR